MAGVGAELKAGFGGEPCKNDETAKNKLKSNTRAASTVQSKRDVMQ